MRLIPGVPAPNPDSGSSLSRRSIECKGEEDEVDKKRWTKGLVDGREDVRAKISVRRFEDS